MRVRLPSHLAPHVLHDVIEHVEARIRLQQPARRLAVPHTATVARDNIEALNTELAPELIKRGLVLHSIEPSSAGRGGLVHLVADERVLAFSKADIQRNTGLRIAARLLADDIAGQPLGVNRASLFLGTTARLHGQHLYAGFDDQALFGELQRWLPLSIADGWTRPIGSGEGARRLVEFKPTFKALVAGRVTSDLPALR